MNTITDIPVDRLIAHPDNSKLFSDLEGESWDFFKADIAEHGILQPLLVTGEEGGGHTVLSGHQRLRAARALDFKTAPCIVWNGDGNHRDILLSSNLGRQLTMMERYRLTIHLLDKMEDGRKDHERDKNGRFYHSVQSAQNGKRPRDRVAEMVPGINRNDITVFRKIRELPEPVQMELFKYVERENPNKRALKVKVNALNAEKRRLKAALREEKKMKLKKKEMEQLEEFSQAEIDPEAKYDARCFDETITAVNKAAVEVPRLIADVLSFSPLSARTAAILDNQINALSKVLFEQRRLLLARWEDHKPPEIGEDELEMEADI